MHNPRGSQDEQRKVLAKKVYLCSKGQENGVIKLTASQSLNYLGSFYT